jgi:hypothetical protein
MKRLCPLVLLLLLASVCASVSAQPSPPTPTKLAVEIRILKDRPVTSNGSHGYNLIRRRCLARLAETTYKRSAVKFI